MKTLFFVALMLAIAPCFAHNADGAAHSHSIGLLLSLFAGLSPAVLARAIGLID